MPPSGRRRTKWYSASTPTISCIPRSSRRRSKLVPQHHPRGVRPGLALDLDVAHQHGDTVSPRELHVARRDRGRRSCPGRPGSDPSVRPRSRRTPLRRPPRPSPTTAPAWRRDGRACRRTSSRRTRCRPRQPGPRARHGRQSRWSHPLRRPLGRGVSRGEDRTRPAAVGFTTGTERLPSGNRPGSVDGRRDAQMCGIVGVLILDPELEPTAGPAARRNARRR